MAWQPAERLVVALFNFPGQGEHQLSLEVGDMLCITEENGAWYRGHHCSDSSKMGIFPACVVYIKEHTTVEIGNKSVMVPAEDEVALEASHLLREWRAKLIGFFLDGKTAQYRKLLVEMEDILSSRRHLLKSNATLDVLQSLRTKLTAKLDQVNHTLSLPVSPRDDNGKLLNCYVTGLHKLYRVHNDRKKELDSHVTETGALNRKEDKDSSYKHMHHLFIRINKIDHTPVETSELFFFLYDTESSSQISERFIKHIVGSTSYLTKEEEETYASEKSSILFTDLGSRDLDTNGMRLVCQIVRRGKMILDDKKNIAQNPYRRPYACGFLEVSSLLQAQEGANEDGESSTFQMPLYICSSETDFSTLHTHKKAKSGGGQKFTISLKVKAFHGDLNSVKVKYPESFVRPIETVHKLGFPDVILPGDVRNDIYVTVESGVFEKGTKRSERNVEVAIQVFDGSNQIIPRAIVLAAGGRHVNQYESFIFYHNNTPKWAETFKLSIPFDKLPDAHLQICFRHVAKAESKDKSEKTFAFAFMKIMRDDGSIIPDGQHELYVYKADHKKWYDPKTYLSYASCKTDVIENRASRTFAPGMKLDTTSSAGSSVPRSFKETITVSTLTCSTKLTQKIELLMLLKWRQGERDLSVVLTNMLHIGGEEVVKFLQDTLDCLFEILSTNQEVYGEKIFEVLVSIFGLMQDDKYQHFNTVLDIYITKHFSAMLAHRFLVWCFEKHVREYGTITNLHSKKLCPVLKSMQYLFRFMIQSHNLYKKLNKKEDPQFVPELKQVFASLSSLMAYQENRVKDVYLVQSIVLGNLPSVLGDVVSVLSVETIASLLSQFLDSIRNTHATLPRDKLHFMLHVLDSPIRPFHSVEARKTILPTFVSHLIGYMDHTMPKTNYKPEVQSNMDCMVCLGRLLEVLGEEEVGTTSEDAERVMSLLLPLLRLSKVIPRNNPLYNHSMVNLIGVMSIMEDKHYASLITTQKSTFGSTLKDFLMDFMMAITSIIKYPIFPDNWVTLYLMQSKVLARALSNISKAMLDSFLDAHSFNPLIWDEFFSICTSFITQKYLQLEVYSDYRRNIYLQQFGDFRVTTGKQVILLWHKLGSHKGQFIPDLIKPFLKISLLKQRDLRRIAIPLVFDVIKCEQQVNGNFKRVETEVFDQMDELVFSGQGDEEYAEMFKEILTAQCKTVPTLQTTGVSFIDTVARLVALLLDYRSVPTDEHLRVRRMGCMLNLLHFYKEIEKDELYVKYIYKLTELHVTDHSFTEAGFTLLLHASGLEWATDQTVAAAGGFPTQTLRERKERLYMRAIELFNQGKSWECGIPLCKELAHQYELEMFDYTKLVTILQKQAEFFRKIIDIQQLRVAPEYFMVGYYGKGFPSFLRNKIFIHRGQPYEKLGGFIKTLTDEFTSAEILKTTTPPGSDIQNSNGMHLQVRTVLPIAKVHDKFKGKNVPDKIAEYYHTNEVQEFRYDRPFHKGKKNKECEFASLWIDRTTFTTVDSFPGVISWFEVKEVNELELDPLGIALETMENKNQEIQLQTAIYSADRTLSINPLSMLLNGVIDAAVMGGIGNYEKIFFNPAYISEHPDDAQRVKKLRSLIEEQTVILEKALALHGQLIDQQLQGFHSKLEQCFEDFQCIVFPEKRKAKITPRKVMRSATIARPLPPTPLDNSGPAPLGPPTSGGRATLPNKMRRATGVSRASHRIQTYEDTEIEFPTPPQSSSISSASPSKSNNLRKSSSPASPYHIGGAQRKSRESSPKLPSPYQTKKQQLSVSQSTGDVADLSKRKSQHSSNSSLDQLSDTDAYEPIADFLKGSPGSSGTPSVPRPKSGSDLTGRQQDVEALIGGPPSSSSSQSTFSPPSYPAPVPPAIPPKAGSKSKKHQSVVQEGDDEEDDDDDGYTQVSLDGGQVEIQDFSDDVERAVLPLLSSSSTRSSFAGGDSSNSSPMRGERSERPPDVVPTSATKGSSRVTLPPEPTSPPPSPPTSGRGSAGSGTIPASPPVPISGPGKNPSPMLGQRITTDGHSPISPPLEEQPKLPPKKRNKQPSVSSSVVKDDDIYSFDSLATPKPTPSFSSSPKPPVSDDDIYSFDTLEDKPPKLPKKSESFRSSRASFSSVKSPPYQPKSSASTPSVKPPTAPFKPSYADENIYEFDSLDDPPPIAPKTVTASPAITQTGFDVSSNPLPPKPSEPPPIPRKSLGSSSRTSFVGGSSGTTPTQPAMQYHDDSEVYAFDALEEPLETPPAIPKKPGSTPWKAEKPQVQMHDDNDIYSFDSLDPKSNEGQQAKGGLTPETGQPGDMAAGDDDVYFDHLVTGQPPSADTSQRPNIPPRPPSTTKSPMPSFSGKAMLGNPPKNSPPVLKKPGINTSPESAPPVPMKKKSMKGSKSYEVTDGPDAKLQPQKPVIRTRVNTGAMDGNSTPPTIPRKPSDSSAPAIPRKPSESSAPSIPPKSSTPQIPPRPKLGSTKINGDSKPLRLPKPTISQKRSSQK